MGFHNYFQILQTFFPKRSKLMCSHLYESTLKYYEYLSKFYLSVEVYSMRQGGAWPTYLVEPEIQSMTVGVAIQTGTQTAND